MHAFARKRAACQSASVTAPKASETKAGKHNNIHSEPDLLEHDFGRIDIFPVYATGVKGNTHADIPTVSSGSEPFDDQPVVDTGTGGPAPVPAPVTAATDSCQQPRSMHKLTSGAFHGGLTMDSYYPDLAGKGHYAHPATAGTFDTGSRVGANVQLFGVIPSPCDPGQFRLEQTVRRTRRRDNGVISPEEGKTFDDIAKSGRDATKAPFRQEFLGGGTAPLGYIISMADPPNTGYNGTSNIERDRDFVTSLAGPGGKQSVSWSLSTRIVAGAVTTNVLT